MATNTDKNKVSEAFTGYSKVMPILDHHSPFPCLERTKMPLGIVRLFKFSGFLFCCLVIALLFLPWQQFIRGTGKVVAYDPKERTVMVEAPLDGMVDSINVVEGSKVKKGDVLFQLADNDPNLLDNLKEQESAITAQHKATKASLDRLDAQLKDLEESVPQAIIIAEKQLQAAEAAKLAADQQFERVKELYEDPRGLVSQREYELAILQRDSKQADTLKSKAEWMKTRLDMNATLEKARASRASVLSDLKKIEKELKDIEIKISQMGRQSVIAPRDGIVFRVTVTEGTFIKSSSTMCYIIPNSEDLVVEMWVDGNDIPLIHERQLDENGEVLSKGSPVRLQFEGWPAIQFVGWPSVAVGTFGGEVIFVDPTDDGMGRFRILVAPDPDYIPGREIETINWPEPPILRQGVLSQGWVLLERVPLWYEVWRQLNGFPPVLSEESSIRKRLEK